jgi:uncharacterized membrane protein YjjP (DUF1212 family)
VKHRTAVVTHQMSPGELADSLRVIMRLGMLMLRGGSASFRVEEAMIRTAYAMGIERLDAYVTPTGIIASAYSGREHRTQIVRIPTLGVDMNRVVELELLSRNIPDLSTPEVVAAQLDAIEKMGPLYRRWQVAGMVGLACGSLAVILGGGPLEFAAAACGATVAQSVRFWMIGRHFNPIPITVICAAIATAVSYALAQLSTVVGPHLGLAVNPRLGVIASVLLLVPGVPLVAAVVDLTHFDLVSGTTRGMYATLLFISIGLGMLIILAWTGLRIL